MNTWTKIASRCHADKSLYNVSRSTYQGLFSPHSLLFCSAAFDSTPRLRDRSRCAGLTGARTARSNMGTMPQHLRHKLKLKLKLQQGCVRWIRPSVAREVPQWSRQCVSGSQDGRIQRTHPSCNFNFKYQRFFRTSSIQISNWHGGS